MEKDLGIGACVFSLLLALALLPATATAGVVKLLPDSFRPGDPTQSMAAIDVDYTRRFDYLAGLGADYATLYRRVKLPVGKRITKLGMYSKRPLFACTILRLYRVKLGQPAESMASAGWCEDAVEVEYLEALAIDHAVVQRGYDYYVTIELWGAGTYFYGGKIVYR